MKQSLWLALQFSFAVYIYLPLFLNRHFPLAISSVNPFHESQFPDTQTGAGGERSYCHYFPANASTLIIQLVMRNPRSLFQPLPFLLFFAV
jgi:hypothetical protein